MKVYKVTFREWMYQEKEIIVEADTRTEALQLAEIEQHCSKDEWYGSKFKTLKPKISRAKGSSHL
jgi:hypothetical protein